MDSVCYLFDCTTSFFSILCLLVCTLVWVCMLAVVVTMYGIVDPKTGMVINLVNLGAAMKVSVPFGDFD